MRLLLKLLNSFITKSTSTLEAISCSVKSKIYDSRRSWAMVFLNLLFTIFNFENTRSHEQLVTGIMLNICSILKKQLKILYLPESFNQSSHKNTDSLLVPLGTFLSVEFLRSLISAIKVSDDIFANFSKMVAISLVIFKFIIFATAFTRQIVSCLNLEFIPEIRSSSNG